MTRIGPPITFADFVELAIEAAGSSTCRSQRGAIAFLPYEGDRLVLAGIGFNQKPDGTCNGSRECKATCRREAVHAEQAILTSGADLTGADVIHVKAIGGVLVVSGPPDCVECSKLLMLAGVVAVWLYHAEGWRRYPIAEFHRRSIEAGR